MGIIIDLLTGITKLRDAWPKINQNFTNIKTKVDAMDVRVDTIITTPVEGVSAEEIVDARVGEASLGIKIRSVDTQLAEIPSQIDSKIGTLGSNRIFAGSCLNSALPVTPTDDEEYWFVSDLNTNKAWNGTAWVDIGNALKITDGTIIKDYLSTDVQNLLAGTYEIVKEDVVYGIDSVGGTASGANTRVNNIPFESSGQLKSIGLYVSGDGGMISFKLYSRNLDGTFNLEAVVVSKSCTVGINTLAETTDFVPIAVEKGWFLGHGSSDIILTFNSGGDSFAMSNSDTGDNIVPAASLSRWSLNCTIETGFLLDQITDNTDRLNAILLAGSVFDQTLNTTSVVNFASVTAPVINTTGTIPSGTLASPPGGIVSGDVWADTTDSATYPTLRVKV